MKNKDNNVEEKFPGYPHYGKKEDIYKHAEEINADIEDIGREEIKNLTGKIESPIPNNDFLQEELTTDDFQKNVDNQGQDEYNITKEDLLILSSLDDETDSADNEEGLNVDRVYPIDMTADDLDIPGAEEDDENEMIGEEDEENNFYSLPDQDDKQESDDQL